MAFAALTMMLQLLEIVCARLIISSSDRESSRLVSFSR